MEFTQFDFSVIVVMSFAVITMSFIFPALGLTGDNVAENDVPEYNSTVSKYEYRAEFPSNPGSPSKGVMHWNEQKPESEPSQSIFLNGDTSNGTEIAVVNTGTTSDPEMQVTLQNWTNGGSSQSDLVTLNYTEYGTLSANGFDVTVHFDRQSNVNTSSFTAEVEFTVNSEPSDSTWYDRVPVVGGIISAGSDLAAIVGWIGSILFWAMGTVVSILWQSMALVLDVITFGIDMLHWLLIGYFGIIDGASDWAAVMVLVPGIALFLEFMKITMITVDLIWFG